MLTHVDLFSGIGGFSLAARWAGVQTIAFAEIDPYASRVLTKNFGAVRNYGDVRNVPSLSAWLLTAGVPCQPASVAGKRRGAADDRWLWPQALAVVENGSYEWLIFENPTGILSLNDGVEFERICVALESQGYEVQPTVIPACGIGAWHRRNRVWILAHSTRERVNGSRVAGASWRPEPSNSRADVAYTNEPGPQGWISAELRQRASQQPIRASGSLPNTNGEPMGRTPVSWRERNQWAVEPDVGRVADGIPKRVDRLRGLGNAIVPQVAYQLIKRMIETEAA